SASALAAIDLPASKEQMAELGRKHATAWDLYKDFEKQAGGGQRLTGPQLPDWSGTYTRAPLSLTFDSDQRFGGLPTAKLTPEYEKRLTAKLDGIKKGIEFDNLSN